MGQSPPRKVVIRSVPSEAAEVQRQILDAVEAAGYDEHARFAIRLALDEAMSNAIHHGNCDDPKRRVTVEYQVDEREARVSITDEGCGFKPEALPDPTLDENLLRPGGRGVMLIKAYMTDVRYSERGNKVIMVKRRDCKLPVL